MSELSVQHVCETVVNLRDIPTLSVVLNRISDLIRNPNASRRQIAEVLRRDQVLTAKILRTVNSSFFGRTAEITDVAKALGFLGDTTVSAIVLGTSAFSRADLEDAAWFDVLAFWRHCVGSAFAAERIARKLGHPRPEEPFTCALLHDLGKIALYRADKRVMRLVIDKACVEGRSFLEAETDLGLPGHHVLGERLGERWHLPLMVRKAIRYHHRDVAFMGSLFPPIKTAVMITTLADALARRLGVGFCGDALCPAYPPKYLTLLKITEDDLREIEKEIPAEADRAQLLLSEHLAAS